ncbi:MAG: hypothetical protein Kow0081_1300 [Candidatus Dojkabacteria bacterium]
MRFKIDIKYIYFAISIFILTSGGLSLRISYLESADTNNGVNVAGLSTSRDEFELEINKNLENIYIDADFFENFSEIRVIPKTLSGNNNNVVVGSLNNKSSFRKDFVISFMVKGYVQDIVSLQFLSDNVLVPVTEESNIFEVSISENSSFDLVLELGTKEKINFPFEINLKISH